MVFRRAIAADLPPLVALVNSAYRGESSRLGWTTEADLLGGQRLDLQMASTMIDGDQQQIRLLEIDGVMRGAVYLRCEGSCAYLGMLTVAPEAQGKGYGDALLTASEKLVRAHWGCKAIRMTVIAQRSELIGWYQRRGYALTGERETFPYGDARFGEPLRGDLYFVVLAKPLAA